MKDIALFESIYTNQKDGVSLQQYILDEEEETDLYLLELFGFDVFEYRKFMDGDLLSLQVSTDFMDKLCEAWLKHRKHEN